MRFLGVLFLSLMFCAQAWALEPGNLVLVVNKNVPEGRKLAEHYAASRKVPDGRILELDLPDADEVSFENYENRVIPTVRTFLAAPELQAKVTCLVTFYGVPLRIGARVNSPEDIKEFAALGAERTGVVVQIGAIVKRLEAQALALESKFVAGTGQSFEALLARDTEARKAIVQEAVKIEVPADFNALMDRVDAMLAPLDGVARPMQRRLQALATAPKLTAQQKQEADSLREQLTKVKATFEQLQAHRGQAASRAQLRALVKEQVGLIEYARLLDGMLEYFSTEDTGAAFDSELALVNWNFYVRGKSLPNPLQYRTVRSDLPPILMTCRLDAPTPELVRNLIRDGIKTEAAGLTGQVVIDAGGNLSIDSKNAGYGAFDRTLHNLAGLVREKTSLSLMLDEGRDVIPVQSVKDPIGIYCGWYALQNYTPPGGFAPGAVGYHVASFELTTLHNPRGRQWCTGLLNDGVVATLGAVREPFLNAFPPPDEFFPLLFTGKLTLAEVYWKTNPMVSWQIAIIGDPLYNPFKAHPAMGAEALPPGLRTALKPATRPVR